MWDRKETKTVCEENLKKDGEVDDTEIRLKISYKMQENS